MAKNYDRHDARDIVGKSNVSHFRIGEDPKDRHDRRLRKNLANRDTVEGWCKGHGISIQIKNEGNHWIFTKDKKKVEWWPSSAKLVINKDWKNGIHTHGFDQVFGILEIEFPEEDDTKDPRLALKKFL